MPKKIPPRRDINAVAVSDKALNQFNEKALSILETAKSITVEDDDQMLEVGEFLKGCKATLKDLDETFDDPIRAARESLDTIRDAKKKYSEPVKEAEAIVKEKLGLYNTKRMQIAQQKNMEALQTAAKTGDMTALSKADAAPKIDGVSFREKWTGTIVDLRAVVKDIVASKAPVDLVCEDKSACNRFAEATKGQIQVNGLKVEKDQIVSSKAS